MSKIILPKKFIDRSPDGKYKHLNGKNKISYSQWTSWKSNQYRPGYIKQYIVGISLPDGIFSSYGSSCGTFIESIGTGSKECHEEYKHWLSEEDRIFLQSLEYPENSIYEDYIVVDMGDFVIEGYADRIIYNDKNIRVQDFKTGSIAKKKAEYASPEYKQTRLYSYQKENEGHSIDDCGVILLDRAGNNSQKSPLRLTGKFEYIPTPYNRSEIEEYLDNDVRKIVTEISDYYQKYLKLFK